MSDTPTPGRRPTHETLPLGTDRNPFPAVAVPPSVQGHSGFWSIETEALKQARGQLQDYLRRAALEDQDPALSDSQGVVMAIVGEYGTGKTHIAQDMLHQITLQQDGHFHPLYLDAPSDSFLALYRDRFIKKLNRDEVLQRVDDYYADIVADELESSELTRPVAVALRERKASADQVVGELGLMESVFIDALGKRLTSITKQSDFGTALLLLRRPEFQAAVWEWLEGNPPDTILEERGISRQIATDAAALEAIGVMAFLFGQQRHRFILFIDELEKILSFTAAHRPSEAAILALKKLMEAMSETRALLVLVGLPEFEQFLPDDARQRIASFIRPSALTTEDIEMYIREANRRSTGKDTIDPFTLDTIRYLAEIASGNARKVVRLCYHAWIAANAADSRVTPSLLRDITREHFESTTTSDVIAETARTIEARGWLFEQEKVFDPHGSEKRIDFWLPVGEEGAGIAILIISSILREAEVKALAEHTAAVAVGASERTQRRTVLVVNGYVADNLRAALELARIGSLLFIFADSPNDQIGSSSIIDTFATRLSAQPLRGNR